MSPCDLEIELTCAEPCYELALPGRPAEAPAASAASAPGSVSSPAPGACVLYFAPERWLLTGFAPEAAATLAERLAGPAAALIDARSKWCRIAVRGSRGAHLLARVLAVEQVLGTRACAACSVLDCPVIIQRSGAAFDLWVGRSWAPWLHATFCALAPARAASLLDCDTAGD
jgi:sarcosine oxidase gamma subunit